ncbi:MAG: biotin transporter BioY [Neomegalonema sp.]|nr:biotin transporter BioY [Neomegalonema sp.]
MSTKDVVYVALFCALTAALGLLPMVNVPLVNVPITAQTFGVMLAGGVLGATRGGLSQALFIGLVAAGLPLLAGGRGGLGILAGPTGGFLLGFAVGGYVTGFLIQGFWARLNALGAFTACVLGGVVAVYLIGIPWMIFVAGFPAEKALIGAGAFVPGDLIKAALATPVILAVKRAYPLIAAQRG